MKIETLHQFYELMHSSVDLRRKIVSCLIENQKPDETLVSKLKKVLESLLNIKKHNDKYLLILYENKFIQVDFSYEIEELKKDIFYLTHSEDEFYDYLSDIHDDFFEQLSMIENKLQNISFNNFISDRDGSINNYCSRYASSVQSVYNAVFLTRFSEKKTNNSIILTSAPLIDIGLVDMAVSPAGAFIFAGSKGREYFNSEGEKKQSPVEKEKQLKLDLLNECLSKMVKQPKYEMFSLIGSGLQFKFGQTTIARQDINKSIPDEKSLSFLSALKNIVNQIDDTGDLFRIEDTGLDIEIILTIESKEGEGMKDFDKGDGIEYLAKELDLKLEEGINLICGDTSSDIPMVETIMKKNSNTWSVFVTKDNKLIDRVKSTCPNNIIVNTPDILVSALNNLSLI